MLKAVIVPHLQFLTSSLDLDVMVKKYVFFSGNKTLMNQALIRVVSCGLPTLLLIISWCSLMWPYLSAYPSVGLVESFFSAFRSHKAKHDIMAKVHAWYSIKHQASDARHHWKDNEVGKQFFIETLVREMDYMWVVSETLRNLLKWSFRPQRMCLCNCLLKRESRAHFCSSHLSGTVSKEGHLSLGHCPLLLPCSAWPVLWEHRVFKALGHPWSLGD